MEDIEKMMLLLNSAGIEFTLEKDVCGWTKVLKLAGDRMFVFNSTCLCGMRSHDDQQSFDER